MLFRENSQIFRISRIIEMSRDRFGVRSQKSINFQFAIEETSLNSKLMEMKKKTVSSRDRSPERLRVGSERHCSVSAGRRHGALKTNINCSTSHIDLLSVA